MTGEAGDRAGSREAAQRQGLGCERAAGLGIPGQELGTLGDPLGEQCLGSSIRILLLPRMWETCEEEDWIKLEGD